jgi:hypothetical protein
MIQLSGGDERRVCVKTRRKKKEMRLVDLWSLQKSVLPAGAIIGLVDTVVDVLR